MFNLLTETAQHAVAREYRLRVIAAVCIVVALEVGIAILGGLFAFQAFRTEAAVWRRGVSAVGRMEGTARNETHTLIERTIERLALLATPLSPPLAPGIVELLTVRVPGISLVSLAVEATAEGDWALTAQGTAETRDTLASFERALIAHRVFTGVEIPVESFAKETHASFTLRALYRAPRL